MDNAHKWLPYVGVTDFATHAQVLEAVECIPTRVDRRLHVGVMMSYKTLYGIPTETGWEKIWPDEAGLRKIFQPHPKVFNVLHYADYGEPANTTGKDLVSACRKAGPYLDGLQLDMIWPRLELLKEVKNVFPDLEIIVQVGKNALDQIEERRGHLIHSLDPYLPYAGYFLFDCSMGKGLPMDVPTIIGYLREGLTIVPATSLAVGGGLGPVTYAPLEQIFEVSPLISYDAQGQLRSTGSATDPIEMDRVCSYIRRSCSLL